MSELDERFDYAEACYESPVGPLTLLASSDELIKIGFSRDLGTPGSNRVLDATRRALDRYFAKRFATPRVPLALRGLAEFQLEVVQALLRHVPAGEVISYGELARLAGRPRAARAVGTTMARNPWPILVPCHRVLAQGGPGGYGPGLLVKRMLLAHEGVTL